RDQSPSPCNEHFSGMIPSACDRAELSRFDACGVLASSIAGCALVRPQRTCYRPCGDRGEIDREFVSHSSTLRRHWKRAIYMLMAHALHRGMSSRFGSQADKAASRSHVCFTPESGHCELGLCPPPREPRWFSFTALKRAAPLNSFE